LIANFYVMKLPPKLIYVICLLSSTLSAQNIKLTSPNGNIIFSFKLSNKTPVYSISFKGQTLVDNSAVSLNFDNGNFEHNLRINKPVFKDTSEDYGLIAGKTKNVHSHYHEAVISLEETVVPKRKINLTVRAFDD